MDGGRLRPLRFTVTSVSAVAMVLAALAAVRDGPPGAAPRDELLEAPSPPAARTTALYDGTPASRFDPVSEHAAAYNPAVPKQDGYHVARLTGVDTDGSSKLCGRAEVRHDNTWGSICYRGFTQTDAHMFCKTMGLTGGSARYSDGLKDTWDDTAITHRDLTDATQRAQWGRGTASDPPLQDDVPVIWMTEVQCAGNEANILDCPFGGKPGEGVCARVREHSRRVHSARLCMHRAACEQQAQAQAQALFCAEASRRRCDAVCDVGARRQPGRECAQRVG